MPNQKQINQQLLTRLSEATAIAGKALHENETLTERRDYAFAYAAKAQGVADQMRDYVINLTADRRQLIEDVGRAKDLNLSLLQLLNRAADLLPDQREFLDQYHALLEQSLALYEPQTDTADVVDIQPE